MSAASKRASSAKQSKWIIFWVGAVLVGAAGMILWRLPAAHPVSNTQTAEKQIYAGYAGSASCRECHAEEYKEWAQSHHALAERLPSATRDDAAFVPAVTFHHGSQQTVLRKLDGQYQVVATGLHSTQEVFHVDRIIGESPLRQMLVPFPGGRWQATEAAYDPRSNQWFDVFGKENRQPGEWGHWTGRGMNWNSQCAACHNTRLLKNYDAKTDSYHTTMAERGVGCEACHGPMQAHNDWQLAHKNSHAKDPTIRKLSRDQMLDTCAACHSRRSEITGDPKPGDSYFDHHLLAIVDESDVFYPDGQIHDENYEFTAFLGSKMYQHGVRCVDCHNPHTGKTILPGNLLCLRCHDGSYKGAPVINPVTHSHHLVFGFSTNGAMLHFDLSTYQPDKIKETGGECINCHMPQTVYMQRHWRHDHGFTIPDPLLTKQFNIPNACNRCHQDKDADWSLKYVEQWYGEKMNRSTRTRAQIIARARNGDDSARDGLLKILQTDPQGYWRAVAAKLLARWVDETPVNDALVNQLADTNALVRQSIVQTLATLGNTASPEIHAALNKSLDDASRNVRVVAALALAPELDLQSPAGRDLLQMLAQNADQPAGQMQLGGFDFTRGDVTNALRHFQTAERWDAHSPEIRNQIAVVYDRIGQPDEAVKELQTAIKLAPNEAEYHFKLALAWNELGQSAKTLAELETAVKLDPHFARAQYNLGLAQNAAGNPAGAIQALLAAEAADPRDPRIPYARATIYAQLGQWDAARQAAQRALKLNPQFTAAAALLQQLQTQ